MPAKGLPIADRSRGRPFETGGDLTVLLQEGLEIKLDKLVGRRPHWRGNRWWQQPPERAAEARYVAIPSSHRQPIAGLPAIRP
jgi:hypothetical protein